MAPSQSEWILFEYPDIVKGRLIYQKEIQTPMEAQTMNSQVQS